MKNKHEISMTSGSLAKNILLFSLPLMMSQILEVLFNLSDIAVAGKFADYRALGSVGSTTLLVSLFTGFLIGLGNMGLGNTEKAVECLKETLQLDPHHLMAKLYLKSIESVW